MSVDRTENNHCPTCNRREAIVVKYDVVTSFSREEGRRDTWTTVSAACRHGHPLPGYVGEKD